MTVVRTGLEIFAAAPERWVKTPCRAGLLYNTASVDSSFTVARDVVRRALGESLVSLFGPQHGVNSDVQDNMIETGHALDPALGLPVWSLYGETRKPTPKMLEGLDVLLVDLTDVGCRVYTFMWTLLLTMEACGEAGVKVVVLDRPNPIGGAAAEGNLLDPRFSSFVGLRAIPMRHGLTIGELALWFNRHGGVKCDVSVVRAQSWTRESHHPATGLPWAMPSPNMPSYDTALVYCGTVLLEGTSASEGRGTTRPFEIFGAAAGKPEELARELNALKLPGAHFRPLVYQPTFHKGAGQNVFGAFLHVTSAQAFKPYLTGLGILSTLWRLYGGAGFSWRLPPYEYEEKELPIHLLLGSEEVRVRLEAGEKLEAVEESWQDDLNEWLKERGDCLLY